MLFVTILAVASIVFACIEGFKTWGIGAPIGFGVGFGVLTLFVPFGAVVSLIACMVLFAVARKSRMAKIAAGDDDIELQNQ